MPRQRRVVIPGIAHHVTQRGNSRRHVFFTNDDRELYLSLLKEYAVQRGVGVIGYCLMTNHVHLIVVPGNSTALAKALGRTLSEGLADAEIQGRLHEATRTGRPLGEDNFVERCQHENGLCLRKQKPGPKPKAPLVRSAHQSFDYHEA
jgi:hypothetical protein